MTVETIDPRDAARNWIAAALAGHCSKHEITHWAEALEVEATEKHIAIETVVEWCWSSSQKGFGTAFLMDSRYSSRHHANSASGVVYLNKLGSIRLV